MSNGHITERADKFAKKYHKPAPEPDNRSMDEKMAEFMAEYNPVHAVQRRRMMMKKDQHGD